MYAAVPRIIPAAVMLPGAAGLRMVGEFASVAPSDDDASGSSAFARPKSSTFTVPSGRTLMLAGLRSR
jgi:hypothetical protein